MGQSVWREHGEDMKTMIGRLRKSKRDSEEYELELIPIAGGRIIDLEARLHKYNYTKHSKSELADVNDPAVRAEINAKQLEAFASDKRKRQVNRMNAARKLDEASIASPKVMEAHIRDGGQLEGRANSYRGWQIAQHSSARTGRSGTGHGVSDRIDALPRARSQVSLERSSHCCGKAAPWRRAKKVRTAHRRIIKASPRGIPGEAHEDRQAPYVCRCAT